MNEAEQNLEAVKGFFEKKLTGLGRDGVVGVAVFHRVYEDLMPQQQARLEQMSGKQFSGLLENGSIICIGIAYPESAINTIDAKLADGTVDKSAWTSTPESTTPSTKP